MNSGFRPLAASMPLWSKVDIMMRRGEAKTKAQAIKIIKAQEKQSKQIEPQKVVQSVVIRLPYAEN